MTSERHGFAEKQFLFAFAISAAFFLLLAMALRLWPLTAKQWDEPERRSVLEALPPDEVTAWKLSYALSAPAFDIGLFGNSRTFGLGRQHLVTDRSFYNFSVGGMSFRNGIAMLETLAAAGKAPRLAVLAVDYAELGLPGILPVTPAFHIRLRNNIDDILALAGQHQYRGTAIQVVEVIYAEARHYALALNPFYIAAKLRVMGLLPIEGRSPRTQLDGSRIQYPRNYPLKAFEARRRSDRYLLEDRDFSRLQQLQGKGIQIILFETALFPEYMDKQEKILSRNAADFRMRMTQACSKYGILCLPAPRLSEDPDQWEDDNHPLPAALAPWFQDTVLNRH
ncbi:MAG: hypothetical protein VW600_06960 [Ferrovibrio sp.]